MQAENANSPLADLSISWGGPQYPAYSVFASTPAVTPPASPAAPAAAPSAVLAATPASPANGTPPASSSGPSNEDNLRNLREGYERYKPIAEQVTQLGAPDEVVALARTVIASRTGYAGIAEQLGYDKADFAAAFTKDPIKTAMVLQREQQEQAAEQRRNGGRPPQPDINKLLDTRLKPFEEKLRMQEAKEANDHFDNEIGRLISAGDFKDAPKEVTDFLYDMTSEMLKYDDAALLGLKEGKVAPVQKVFNDAVTLFTKAFTAWQNHTTRRGTDSNSPPAAPGAKKPSLDDFINGTDAAAAVAKSFR